MLAEGALLLQRAAAQIPKPKTLPPDEARAARTARSALTAAVKKLRDPGLPPLARLAAAGQDEVRAALASFPLRDLLTRTDSYPLIVHRQRALYSSWYEFFPRSEGAVLDPAHRRKPRSGTLRTAARRLDAVADMGFDVVYLPPVHPIGTTARKGQNNTLIAGPATPARPGPSAHPMAATTRFTRTSERSRILMPSSRRARRSALRSRWTWRCRPRPTTRGSTEHPEWFTTRADGTIAYAENPPKKYQDIYPLNFDNDPEGIYAEVSALVRHWMEHGVRIFRVDNPHTKPLPFWQRLLADIAATDPDVIFLAEAFTRPAMMHALAAIGFHQSYTYFTWRNTAAELTEYLPELSGPAAALHAAELLRQHARHPVPVPAARRAARVRGTGGARRDDVAVLGRLLGLRARREHPAGARQRGVPGFGEVRLPAAGLGPGGRARHHPRTVADQAERRSGARTRPCTGCATCASTTAISPTSCASPSGRAQIFPVRPTSFLSW